MSAEEFVARKSHRILCFSLHLYEYKDERLKSWLQAVFALLGDQANLALLRERILTTTELAEIQQEIAKQKDEFEHLPE